MVAQIPLIKWTTVFDELFVQLPSIYPLNFIAITLTNILISTVHATFFDRDRTAHNPIQMPTHQLIHTFETNEQCLTNCPRPCVMQILEELEMMPRWICDPSSQSNAQLPPLAKGTAQNVRSLRPLLNDDGGDTFSHSQILLAIAPIVCLLILCVAISLRRCSASAAMATI
ncbi:hypothetical protein niasHT_004647 [Heterodera trifolii]|uniref:Uncharacterized protein n=1 Tax=Heterodera trifolii TaxID=157864 RepID=A0ABD2M963_9BILA